jgi:RNA polymerase sigma factor (sigma-70 family)
MLPPSHDSRTALAARALAWAQAELGPASAQALEQPQISSAVLSRIERGEELDTAVLAEIHAASSGDARLANEFLAHFLPDLTRAGQRLRSRQLKRFLDTGDLVQSMLADAWPSLAAIRFTTRPQFLAFLSQRLRWKASDRSRSLEADKRREDARVELDEGSLQAQEHGRHGLSSAVDPDDWERMVQLIVRLPERDRRLLSAFLAGRSIDEIAAEHGRSRDATRMAIQRAIARARARS